MIPSVNAWGKAGRTVIFGVMCFSGSLVCVCCSDVPFAATNPIYTTRNRIRKRSSLLTCSSNLFLFVAQSNRVLDRNLVPPSSINNLFKSSLKSSPLFCISRNNFPILNLSSNRCTFATSRSYDSFSWIEKSTASMNVVISFGAAKYAVVYVVATCTTTKMLTRQAVRSSRMVNKGRSAVSAIGEEKVGWEVDS